MAPTRAPYSAGFAKLNPSQQEVVTTVDRGCCVISIPGSGKTATVTEKIFHLLTGHQQGHWARPKSVIAVSFTAEAGKELTERIKKLVGRNPTVKATTGTFHSLFMHSLRAIGSAMTARKLASPGQSAQYVDRALEKATNNQFDGYKLEEKDALRQAFERARCNIHDPYGLKSDPDDQIKQIQALIVDAALKEYKDRMKRAGLMDFGMILEEALLFLASKGRDVERTPEYLEARARLDKENGYATEWPDEYRMFLHGATHMIVDEAQDIDAIQLEIIVSIAHEHVIVDIVGDDDQSIYRFRNGLGYAGMMEFTRRTAAKIILMDNNYRCRKEILTLAGEVIAHNTQRSRKDLHAHRGPGGQVSLSEYRHGEFELETMSKAIKEIISSAGSKPATIAVIARINAILDVVQLTLTSHQIPNARMGGGGIWGDAPVCFMLAYLQGLLHRGDPSAADQCLYWAGVRNAIGKATDRDGSLVRSLSEMTNELRHKAWSKADHDVVSIAAAVHHWFCTAILTSDWSEKRKDFNIDRVRMATEMIAGGKAVSMGEKSISQLRSGGEYTSARSLALKGSLQDRLAALQRLDRTDKNDPNAVKIVSMHGSKGLEFDHCWVVGLDDKTIPNTPKLEDVPEEFAAEVIAALEEERRLLYVAMTRARDNLHLSWSHKPIHRPRARQLASECRFLMALPSDMRPASLAPDHDQDRKAGYTV